MLARGILWETTVRSTRRALARGALHPIETRQRWTEDAGVRFCIRYVSSLARKVHQQEAEATAGTMPIDPFLPYDPDMFVADISDTHVALLNKFPVFENHLLLATRAFEDQEALLTQADFEALAICMAEFEALAFYNAGTQAGASQAHKHLQLVPLPLAQSGAGIPVEPLLSGVDDVRVRSLPGLPFAHAFARIDPSLFVWPVSGAQALHRLYLEMLGMLGLQSENRGGTLWQRRPYNLLVSREWMLLVPRTQERFEGISINALGFAGSMFVPSSVMVDTIIRAGPMRALRTVSLPNTG
ncbi:MAG: ATP adenylyltransferase family protein [Chromatiales bacterium]